MEQKGEPNTTKQEVKVKNDKESGNKTLRKVNLFLKDMENAGMSIP
jgi:hypothetical protein